jgi:hypothetical protein
MSQAVNHQLLTMGTGFDPKQFHVGFVVEEMELGQGFLLSLSFHQSLRRYSPMRPMTLHFVGFVILVFRHLVGLLGWAVVLP